MRPEQKKIIIASSVLLAIASLYSYNEGDDFVEYTILAFPIILITIALLYAFKGPPKNGA